LPCDEPSAHTFRPCRSDLFHNGSRERADDADAGRAGNVASNGIAACRGYAGAEEVPELRRVQKEKEKEEKAAGGERVASPNGNADDAARHLAGDAASGAITGGSRARGSDGAGSDT
jgi:hypothetical protein